MGDSKRDNMEENKDKKGTKTFRASRDMPLFGPNSGIKTGKPRPPPDD